MPLLRKLSLDICDASDGDFDIPNVSHFSTIPILLLVILPVIGLPSQSMGNYYKCASLVAIAHPLIFHPFTLPFCDTIYFSW